MILSIFLIEGGIEMTIRKIRNIMPLAPNKKTCSHPKITLADASIQNNKILRIIYLITKSFHVIFISPIRNCMVKTIKTSMINPGEINQKGLVPGMGYDEAKKIKRQNSLCVRLQ